jgi:hypothetical protein
MDTVQRIVTFVTCLTRLCLRSLHHRYVTWTKPDTTSLLLGTLIDQARSKSQLLAENTLLRQQLIILSRPVYSRADLKLAALVKRTPKNKIHKRRRTNADQTAPGLGDPNAEEQTPLTERRWAARQWY